MVHTVTYARVALEKYSERSQKAPASKPISKDILDENRKLPNKLPGVPKVSPENMYFK